eukprot:CAMPEP_0197044322 /NCGR_PEP_ID=MMETSP1384-20130603/20396_1 /TAXON_ID=29189 /ORGANISM="Ammonia sp." /LENGTH=479 /DNA_ID=CAMNT_0042475757 /DNA_START=21 /DNA_END=1460 /DNA_ORIENTATION=-
MNKTQCYDRVAYYYDSEVGNFHYGPGHPMKPFRIHLTHDLVINYNLYRYMNIYRPRLVTPKEMTAFHSDEYISFLSSINPDNYFQKKYKFNLEQFTLGPKSDCPIFDGLFEFNQRSVGGSIDGALRLCYNKCDTAVNWSGGFHHAKKSESSGFCYVNDIVLGIIELLKHFERVLYIDIDVHHGDGVEEAFYNTNRVLSLSLHKYGDGFFPGTGFYKDIGVSSGKYYSVNFPFNDGIDDDGYFRVYKSIIDTIFDRYRPSVVVLQCGADSLTQDRIGVFNISTKGHGRIVEYMKNKYNHNGANHVPMLVVGGGGYNIKNVARLWCYETSILCNQAQSISNTIPYSEFLSYYKPSFNLHVEADKTMINKNTTRYLQDMKNKILQQIKNIEIAPSIQINSPRVPHLDEKQEDENSQNKNKRNHNHLEEVEVNEDDVQETELSAQNPDQRVTENSVFKDQYVPSMKEFYESEKDQDPSAGQTK